MPEPIYVEAPGGALVEFPAGTPPEAVEHEMNVHFGPTAEGLRQMRAKLAEPAPEPEPLGSVLWRSVKEGLGTVGAVLDYPGRKVDEFLGLSRLLRRGAEAVQEATGTTLPTLAPTPEEAETIGRIVTDPLVLLPGLGRFLKRPPQPPRLALPPAKPLETLPTLPEITQTGRVEGAADAFRAAVPHHQAQQRTGELLERAAQTVRPPEAPTGQQATLEAAQSLWTGQATGLDLGEIGRRRAQQRALAGSMAGAALVGSAGVSGTPFTGEPAQAEPEPPIEQAGLVGDLGRLLRRLIGLGEEAAPVRARVAEGALGPMTKAGMEAEPTLTVGAVKDVTDRVVDQMLALGIPRDPSKLVSDQIADLIKQGRFADLTPEMAYVWRADVSKAGKTLQVLSVAEARLREAAGSVPQARQFLATLESAREAARVSEVDLWGRLSGVWKSALVTQLATSVRNAVTQAGNLGLHTIEKAMEAGMQAVYQRVTGKAPVDPTRVWEGAEAVARMFQHGQTRRIVEDILQHFPAEQARMLRQVSEAVPAGSGPVAGMIHRGLDTAQRAYEIIGIANNVQEMAFRRAVFAAKLDARLAAKGLSLDDVIARRVDPRLLDAADVRAAVNEALDLTWARMPEYGSRWNLFIEFANKVPPVSLVLPFPRFLYNSLTWTFEHSPYGLLGLLSKSERAALAAGDLSVFSRAMTGTALLLAADQLRRSPWAGERWYELKLPDGRVVDARPFNPFAAYLFLAELHRKGLKGMTTEDLAQGILSTNMRAGAGLAILDDAIAAVNGLLTGQGEAGQKVAGYAGQITRGFLTPLQQVNDVLDQFRIWQGEKVPRRESRGGFLPPVQEAVPGWREQLPPLVSPTRGTPVWREDPILRQALGLSIKSAKTPLEAELDRLQFASKEILPHTPDPRWDNLVASYMGQRVSTRVTNLLTSPRYAFAPDETKGDMLRRALDEARAWAYDRARRDRPDIYEKVYQARIPRREREAIQAERGLVTPREAERYRRRYERD